MDLAPGVSRGRAAPRALTARATISPTRKLGVASKPAQTMALHVSAGRAPNRQRRCVVRLYVDLVSPYWRAAEPYIDAA